MVLSFKDKRTAALFAGLAVKGLPPSIAQRAFDKLRLLHAASNLDDLRVPPSNRLEKLKRDRRGQWSIRINDQWLPGLSLGAPQVFHFPLQPCLRG